MSEAPRPEGKEWGSGGRERALQASVLLTFPSAPGVLGIAAAQLGFTPYAPRGEVRLDVLVNDDVWRVTLHETARESVTFVNRREVEVAVWDHVDRTWWSVPARVPPLQVRLIDGLAIEWEGDGSRRRAIVGFSDPSFGPVRVELEFGTDAELQPFSLPLFSLLFGGPLCHAGSGFPVEDLASGGLLTGARGFIGRADTPVMTLRLDDPVVLDVTQDDFKPPAGFNEQQPLAWGSGPQHRRPGSASPPVPAGSTQSGPGPTAGARGSGVMRQSTGSLTPECGSESRGGDIALAIHQDLVDSLHNAVNMVSSLLGTATVGNGTITIPWLASLPTSSTSTAPGSGLFQLLVDGPRVAASGATPASGGTGLLDIIAVIQVGKNTQGFNTMTPAQQIPLLNTFETNTLGVFTITGLPQAFSTGGHPWHGWINANISNITGSIDFSTLPGFPGGLITNATIGPAGDIQLGLTLPNIELEGTLGLSLTPAGAAAIGLASAGFCLIFPLMCPVVIATATALVFILDQITEIDVAVTGAGLSIDIQYQWNFAQDVLSPVVTVNSTSGSVNVTSSWNVSNLIASLVDSFVFTVGDLFNAWLGTLVGLLPGLLQKALTDHAIFPPGNSVFTIFSGSAASIQNTVLTLQAALAPAAQAQFGQLQVTPYVTQVDVLANVATALQNNLILARNSLNPGPAGGAPAPGAGAGAGIALTDATYLAVAASQNVLNYYIFQQWMAGDFNLTLTDPATIAAILHSFPPAFAGMPPPHQITVWPATPPRAEVSMETLAAGQRPLIVFFDDVRACFGFATEKAGAQSPAIEFCFNFKTSGTVNLTWPGIFQLAFDNAATPSEESDFDLAISGDRLAMVRFQRNGQLPGLQALANQFASLLITPFSAAAFTAPNAAAPWARPMPSTQQEMLPQVAAAGVGDVQLDILSYKHILYCFPEVTSILLELIDTSGGQPLLGAILGTAAPVNLATITAAQGITLRKFVDGFFPAQDFIPP